MQQSNSFLRHTLATLAYRAAKAIRDTPPDFARFRASPDARTPVEILAHIGDLLDWSLVLASGKHDWHDSTPLPWNEEVARFFRALRAFDAFLGSNAALGCPAAGAPVRAESYFVAAIVAGRVGPDQEKPRKEF